MEKDWKVGEIREVNGEWCQCIVGNDCENCAFTERKCYNFTVNNDPIGNCCGDRRKDNKDVIFKKLEKVGEPYYNSDKKLCQQYKCYTEPLIADEIVYVFADNRAVIEIKQANEDKQTMVEKLKEYFAQASKEQLEKDLELLNRFNESGLSVDDFLKENEQKPGIKPFDLEAARSGKPVCTRDGRKVRILCFDRQYEDYNIVALVLCGNREFVYNYFLNGRWSKEGETNDDLMMLPENSSELFTPRVGLMIRNIEQEE